MNTTNRDPDTLWIILGLCSILITGLIVTKILYSEYTNPRQTISCERIVVVIRDNHKVPPVIDASDCIYLLKSCSWQNEALTCR